MSDEIQHLLRKTGIFGFLDDEELSSFAERFELQHVALGEQVFAEGDAGEDLFVVLSGKIRITKRNRAGDKEVTLAQLASADYFGEVALLNSSPRMAGARAAADSSLLSLSRTDFDELLSAKPELRDNLQRCVANRGLQNFLRLCTQVGHSLKPKDFKAVLGAMEILEVAPGAIPLSHPALYVVQSGGVTLGREGQAVGTVSAGETFGADEVLGQSIGLGARADTHVRLIRLEGAVFKKLLKKAKGLKSYFQGQADGWRSKSGLDTERTSGSGLVMGAGVSSTSGRAPAASGLTLMEMAVPVIDFENEPEAEPSAEVLPDPGKTIRRFPFIEQQEEMDCGAACLAMILKHYGKRVSLSRLRALARVTAQGANMASIVEAAGKVGLVATGKASSLEALAGERFPLVAHWEGVHWIVVYRISETHVWVSDPADGKIKMPREEFRAGYTGRLVVLEPTAALAEVEESTTDWRPFIQPILQHKGRLFEIFLCALALQILGLTTPILTQQIVDRVAVTKSPSLLNLLAMAAAFLYLGEVVLGGIRTYMITFVSTRLQRAMLSNVMIHLLRLPLSFFGLKRPGDILSRFEDSDHIKDVLLGKPIEIMIDLIFVTFYLGVMFYYNVQLTLITLAFVLPFVVATSVSAPIMAAFSRRNMIADSRTESTLIETFNGIETIKSFGVERRARGKWEANYSRSENLSYAEEMVELGFGTLTQLLDHLSKVAVLYLGVSLVLEGQMSIGQLMAFTMMVNHVFAPILGFVGLIDEIQEANVSAERLNEILETPREVPRDAELTRPKRLQGYLRYENVYFRYGTSDSPYVIKNVSFELSPGQKLALVGRSGCGKTTLSRLLLGLYPIDEGRIYVDEIELKELDPHFLRQSVASVPQDTYLFRGSVQSNIAAGDPNPDPQRVVQAASMAAAHDFIAAMPLGYQSDVGEGGGRLSGGQRQRIALARAFYRQPNVLLLDEATSALDTESEATISENMAEFLRSRSCVTIAHRLSTVRSADLILVMDQGEVIEQGTHDELLAKEGLYYDLCAQELAH